MNKRSIGFTGGSVPEEFEPIRIESTNDIFKLTGIGTNNPYTGLFEIINTGKGGNTLEKFVPSWE